jgi:L-arabinose isomerase
VEHWCLGNEMDGPWQIGHMTASEYGLKAQDAARQMRAVDPSLKLIACGSSGPGMPTYLEWDREVLEQCYEYVDGLSLHRYIGNTPPETGGDSAKFVAMNLSMERQIAETLAVCDLVRGHKRSPKRLWLSFDEWNVWIDMDFMNLNQSAHGDREFGFIGARMRLGRKIIVGYWQDEDVHSEMGAWLRAACAWHDAQQLTVARFGDNMRNVAVTEGNKVNAAIKLGYTVNGYGVGDLAKCVDAVTDAEITDLTADYDEAYAVAKPLRKGGSKHRSLLEAAKIEIGLRHFLEDTGSHAFTDTFEDLHRLTQLPGIAVQRLMADGYGFGAEGDWKTAALVRAVKVMSHGLKGGASFMEDYTYHLKDGGQVLGAHMLEVCPSITDEKPSAEIHVLSIGGKADPVRLVFTAAAGKAVNASVVDMGNRFRLIVNEVNLIEPQHPLPKLPVARALWVPEPNLKVAATTWIHAGGAHHTVLSRALKSEHLENFAVMAGMEFLLIDGKTEVADFVKELRWNDMYYHLADGL